jgi:curved DNA-binding protein CbpA
MTQQQSSRPARDAYEVLQVRPDASQVVINAAFRALAALHHPDSDQDMGSTRRMAELNDAYAQIRTADRRAVYDRLRQAGQASQMQQSESQRRSVGVPVRREKAQKGVLDFGRYEGASIAEVARQDPDYLRWLSRHSSGIRYRREIAELLDEAAQSKAASSRAKRK